MKRTVTRILLPVLIVGGALLAWQNLSYLEMISAYKAKTLCAAAFVSGRDIDSGKIEDVTAGPLEPLQYFRTTIDPDRQSVTVSLLGIKPSTAVFREGIGSTLAIGVTPDELLAEKPPVSKPMPVESGVLWPEGELVGEENGKFRAVVDAAFNEPDNPLRTRALVVVHDGRIVAEKYAPGFSDETPLAGWSMAKGVTNALVGILVGDGRLSLDDDALLPEWRSEGDPRAAITIDHLLHMSSGLEFKEDYTIDPDGDISMMLFRTGDASGFAASKPLWKPPGTYFQYASGTSNILCRIIRETIGDDAEYHAFPYRRLFYPIGANSALLERDATGTFIGSSFLYATARDWARLGLLYASDGIWQGERILPEGWVDYSRTPASADPKTEHGAHFWVKVQGNQNRPILPDGIFHMAGHEGQFVSILPEERLVVVRLGFTLEHGAWNQEQFVALILEALAS